MTALLWARPVFAVILLTLVGFYVWAAHKADVERQ
jgi:cytochrome c-type biogenesis protein CcmH/NrfF